MNNHQLNQSDPLGPLSPITPLIWWTCGGTQININRVANLKDEHLSQQNTEHNVALWSLVDLDTPEQQIPALLRQLKVTTDYYNVHVKRENLRTGEYRLAALANGVPDAEKINITFKLHVLSHLYKNGDFKTILQTRKAAKEVKPLEQAIQRATAGKEAGNQLFQAGELGPAVDAYVAALLELYPWTSSPLMFTPEQAFQTGLAEIEVSLWINIVVASRKRYLIAQEVRLHPQAYSIVITNAFKAVTVLLNMRYITRRQLARAYDFRAEIQLHFEPAYIHGPGDPLENLSTRAFSNALEEVAAAIRRLDAASTNTVTNPEDVWAHKNCITNHAGCCDRMDTWLDAQICPSFRPMP